jgi:hypothetical protein
MDLMKIEQGSAHEGRADAEATGNLAFPERRAYFAKVLQSPVRISLLGLVRYNAEDARIERCQTRPIPASREVGRLPELMPEADALAFENVAS